MNKHFITVLKFGISFLILWWLFNQASQADQFDNFWQSEKRVGWLAFALAAGLLTSIVSFYRWFILGRALELNFSFLDAIRLGFLGNLLNLMSVGVLGGDALKSVFLARQMPGRGPEAVASVIFDRAIGLLAMFTFAAVAWLLTDFSGMNLKYETENQALNWVCTFALICSVIGFSCLGVLFFTPRFHKTRLYKKLAGIPKIGGLFKRLVSVALAYRNRFGSVVAAFFLSILVNIGYAAAFFGIARGISEAHPTAMQHLVISPIAMVANAVPLPGGLGGMEAAVAYFYRAFSSSAVPGENGFLVAIGFRIILLVIAGIGLIYYLSSKQDIKELSDSNSKA